MDKMIANGDTPLCVGIESGPATGWPFTDWVEELVLREQGIDYYNQWVAHEVPFNDPPVVDTFNEVAGPDGLWTKKGAVFASGGSIAATAFGDNGDAAGRGQVHDAPPGELLRRLLPRGHQVRRRATARSARSTSRADEGHPVLVGGINAGAFRDAPEVWKVMQYLGSPEFANARQAAQSQARRAAASPGSSPANTNADTSQVGTARAGLPQGAPDRQPGGVRRLRPDARRSRVGHVLDGRHVVRQRRRGRQDGGRQHRGLLADQLTD